MPISRLAAAVFLLLLLPPEALLAQDRTLHLAIGDPARKDHDAPLVLDAVTESVRTGAWVVVSAGGAS